MPERARIIHSDSNGVVACAILEDDGSGKAGHFYEVTRPGDRHVIGELKFQLGPVKEAGINGITTEAILSCLIDRTKILDGLFPCDENKRAIQHMEEALVNLEVRTARRIMRGVEGRNIA